jgi:hypothetical protein
MAFDGNGNYIRIHNWTQDAANGLDINAGEMDAEDNSIQGAFNITVTRDGQGKMAADFTPATTALYNLGTAGRSWAGLNVNAATIGPPAAGNTLTLQAIAGNFGLQINGSATVGQSVGQRINAGTSATDYAFFAGNQANTVEFFRLWGDGGVTIGFTPNPGPGILNVLNGLQINQQPVYVGIPQNLQNANYTFVLADANRHIYHSSGANTWTIPSNAAVPYPVGTAITLVNRGAGAVTLNITADSLIWAPSGGAGSRTLAPTASSGTILKTAATEWMLTGVGIT